MAIVATAKATGGGNILLPAGCNSVADMPWDLARAIDHATLILGWREHLQPDDFPPEWMLPYDQELSDWFDEIKSKHESQSAGDDTPTLERNELAEGRR